MQLQSWAEYLEQSKENKQNWTESEISDNCFYVIFDCYCKSFMLVLAGIHKLTKLKLKAPKYDVLYRNI